MRVFITGTVVEGFKLTSLIDGESRTTYAVSVVDGRSPIAERPRHIVVTRAQFDDVFEGLKVESWPVEISVETAYPGRECFVFELDPGFDVRAAHTSPAVFEN